MKKYSSFGDFIRQKRRKREEPIYKIAAEIGICTVYLSELETGKKTNPNTDIMKKMVTALRLNADETAIFYDLHAKANDIVSQDLSGYIMGNAIVRETLRTARDKLATADDWKEIIDKLK